MKLRTQLIVVFLSLSLVGMGVLGFSVFQTGRRALLTEESERTRTIMELKAAELERWIQANERHLRDLAQRPLVRAYGEELRPLDRREPRFEELRALIWEDHFLPALTAPDGFLDVFLLHSETGEILVSTNATLEGLFKPDAAFFLRGLEETSAEPPMLEESHDMHTLYMSTPVLGSRGEVVAVLAAHMDLMALAAIMSATASRLATEDSYLVSTGGVFLTEPRFGDGYGHTRTVSTTGVERALAGETGVTTYTDYRGIQVVGAYGWIDTLGVAILTEVDLDEALAAVDGLRSLVLLTGLIMAVAITLGSWLLARHISEPIRRLAQTARSLGSGNLSQDFEVRVGGEVGELADAFSDMVDDLRWTTASRDQLDAERRRAELYLDTANVMLVALDEKGRITMLNKEGCRILQTEAEQALGKDWFSHYVPADMRTQVRTMFERSLVGGQDAPTTYENTVISASGERRMISWRNAWLHDATGRVVGTLSSGLDITERLAAEAERAVAVSSLQESERRFRELMEHQPAGIIVFSDDARILYGNPMASEILGVDFRTSAGGSARDSMGVLLREDGTNLPPLQGPVEMVLRTREPVHGYVLGIVSRDGAKPVWVLINGFPVIDEDGSVQQVITAFTDITDRLNAERAKEEFEAQLRQQQKLESIGTLASGVAHEINNPLMGILNLSELIQEDAQTASVREYAERILEEGNRVAAIVRSLLSFARHDSEAHSPARVSDIVRRTMSLLGAGLRHEQIRVDVDVPEDLPQVKCRTQQIEQVLVNLLLNARDALNDRYPGHHWDKVIRLLARKRLEDGDGWVRITVEDHGGGIEPDVIERIFDPFFTTKPRDAGTGLGLSVSFGIMREHRGRLSVETEQGRSTRFHVDLRVDNGWTLECSGQQEAEEE